MVIMIHNHPLRSGIMSELFILVSGQPVGWLRGVRDGLGSADGQNEQFVSLPKPSYIFFHWPDVRIETSNHRDVSRIYYSICKVDDSLESLNPSWPTIYGKIWELRINVYDAHIPDTLLFVSDLHDTENISIAAFFCCHCISSVKSIEMHWRVIQCTAPMSDTCNYI